MGEDSQFWPNIFQMGLVEATNDDIDPGFTIQKPIVSAPRILLGSGFWIYLPLKINGWNIHPWRFGADHFPF